MLYFGGIVFKFRLTVEFCIMTDNTWGSLYQCWASSERNEYSDDKIVLSWFLGKEWSGNNQFIVNNQIYLI